MKKHILFLADVTLFVLSLLLLVTSWNDYIVIIKVFSCVGTVSWLFISHLQLLKIIDERIKEAIEEKVVE